MLRIKPGVKLNGLTPEGEFIIDVVSCIFLEHFPGEDCWITSGVDGVHGPRSLHPHGRALDFRTKFLPTTTEKRKLASLTKLCLGDDYDVILEDIYGSNEHLHVEYDPKEGDDLRRDA